MDIAEASKLEKGDEVFVVLNPGASSNGATRLHYLMPSIRRCAFEGIHSGVHETLTVSFEPKPKLMKMNPIQVFASHVFRTVPEAKTWLLGTMNARRLELKKLEEELEKHTEGEWIP